MTQGAGGITLLLVVLLPVAVALAVMVMPPRQRGGLFNLLPVVPLPGLAVALVMGRDQFFRFPDLLLGVSLAIDQVGGIFLGFIALLWALAGWYARAYLPERARESGFTAFWCATLAGNLGVCIAADVVTFYAFFALVSLAAYGLVVHEGTAPSFRAGRVYIVLAVFGEACLLLGFMLAAQATGGIGIPAARAALAVSPDRDLAILMLVVGFGIKAGLVPLHVWLPLAHPVAPTPASAVLSGAIVNAGILGLLRFLPLELALPNWGSLLVAAGLFTAYYGVLIGLTQSNPKTILAYSTLSQMGIVVTVLGTAVGAVASNAVETATFYALNHGLAKGALFLAVGVIAASGRLLWPVMLATALVAGAIAGLPLTGGALAKLAIKDPLGGGPAAILVDLAAVGTSLLLLRFLIAAAGTRTQNSQSALAPGLLVPWAAAVLASLAVPWTIFTGLVDEPLAQAWAAKDVWAAAWPIAAAVVIALLASRLPTRLIPAVPEGDLVVPIEAAWRIAVVRAQLEQRASLRSREARQLGPALEATGRWLDKSEVYGRSWTLGGAALLFVVLIFGALLAGCVKARATDASTNSEAGIHDTAERGCGSFISRGCRTS